MIFPYIMKGFFSFKKSLLHIFSQWLLSNSLDRASEMGRHVKALTTRPNNEFHTRDWHGVGREPTSTGCCCRLFDHTVTPWDWVNKVNLESGDRPSNWQTGIRHREPRNMDREDAMEGAEMDLEISWIWKCREKVSWSLLCYFFYLSGFHPNIWLSSLYW